jgi:ankyrin repeat protein
MKSFQACWQRLAFAAVVSGCVTQVAAQSGVAAAADPLQNEAAPMPSPAAMPDQQAAPSPPVTPRATKHSKAKAAHAKTVDTGAAQAKETPLPSEDVAPAAQAVPGESAVAAPPAPVAGAVAPTPSPSAASAPVVTTSQDTVTPKPHKSFRSRVGELTAKITPWHGKSAAAKEPRQPKSKTVMRHKPDSAPSAEAKASLRTKQFAAAVQELRTAAEHGDVESEYLLGLVYASGVAPEVSLTEARRWLEAAAGKSNPEAALALSGLLADGSEQDRAAAEEWLARAASEGQPTAIKLKAAHSLPMAPSRDARGDAALARELLVWAIRHGDEKTLDAFIKVAGVENADEFGRTPLQYAVMSGSEVAVQHLLAAGADTGHADHFGVTPLMLAAEAESDAILDELMKAGTDINKKDSVGDTALFYAARVGRTDHAQRLIAAGATFDQSNADGWTVLDVASKAGHPETALALKKAGASGHLKASVMREGGGVDPTRGGELYEGWPPIAIAASRNDARLVSDLLAGGARADEPTPHRDTPLLVAAKYRAAAVIAPLLKAGANPAHFDESGETALGYAAAHSELEVLNALLQKGVSPDTRGHTEEPAVLRATRVHDDTAVKHLIDAGANVNLQAANGTSALMVAAGTSDSKMLELLLTSGAHVELQDKTGRDALWFAADSGTEEIVDRLLAAGAPVDSNRKQQSPLFATVHAGRPGMLEHLIRKGLSPNAKGTSGDTPIISAAARGDAALVSVLVGGGATIDEQNNAGNTALIVAIREGHTNVCKVLLKGGANARVRNKDRIDALDTAKRRNMQEIVALLDAH